jgi:hypothetical protein
VVVEVAVTMHQVPVPHMGQQVLGFWQKFIEHKGVPTEEVDDDILSQPPD